MFRIKLLLFTGFALLLIYSFSNNEPVSPSLQVKERYLQLAGNFISATVALQNAVTTGNEKILKQKFFDTRNAYKKIEAITEYYFSFHAIKLNGPPIVFFEEDEADVPENIPTGMQVIEGLLFPSYNAKTKSQLKAQADELVRYAQELPTINESFEFNDANNFDAFIEELYRVAALGVTGFDSQTAQNAVPECAAALSGVQQLMLFYKKAFEESMPGSYDSLQQYFNTAQLYLNHSANFNSFNRAVFITNYINPLTKITGRYKTVHNLADNPAGMYYSAIKKNGSLFEKNAFNPYRFIDDYSSSAEKIELGRMLFFDTQLSSDNSRSCASCHQPGKAFTDGLKTSLAIDGHSQLPRNAPTIWNAALQRNLFADSRSRTLEEQVMQVLNNVKEMHGKAQEAAEKIVQQEKYKLLYQKAFTESPPANAAQNICNAIACYERTLIALNSRFDKYMNGENTALSAEEINGFNLFMGKAKCGTCHFMPLFGGAKPPRYYYTESEVLGVPEAAITKKAVLDKDSGRYKYTGYPIHLFSFKTPSLRNAALTAPYMHNGVFKTLEEVINFYDKGGGKGLGITLKNQSLPFDKLNLTAKEKKDISDFIKALTDTATAY